VEESAGQHSSDVYNRHNLLFARPELQDDLAKFEKKFDEISGISTRDMNYGTTGFTRPKYYNYLVL
jgi:hypothetical protein